MSEREGVTKFDLRFTPAAAPEHPALRRLIAWRDILHRLALIGQDPARYGGLGFGNVSVADGSGGFLVSGTQTGGLVTLTSAHFARVVRCDPERNRIEAHGPLPPSSEAMTHAVIYSRCAAVGCVLHVHSPSIWRSAARLDLPLTDPQIAYGTPEMARAVAGLIELNWPQGEGVFTMGGHEDGVVSFAADVDGAACNLLRALVG